eukprot:gb/GEZN01005430.1/.p1 GENE.gb/GEZN01005430.1/~~gb/GEZN01005430.1/.p1  ORF type:complete len:483 (-),score=32.85 gb/GEZN01005430.1/:91-1539(-)
MSMNNKRIILIGGCGFVGENLAIALHLLSHTILILDLAPLPDSLQQFKKILFAKCNILDAPELQRLIGKFKPNLVIHLASWGMSGSPMLSLACRRINVKGTHEVLKCCINNNIPNFIYTSTYNVVYGGKEIVHGNEDLPYFPLEEHSDHYAPSKAIAEKMVLNFNGELMKNGKPLRTSCIRPAAIYGEAEQRHLPRILKHIDGGLLFFKIGAATVDWLHVENMVDAFLLLVHKLFVAESINTSLQAAPAGQAYFISDGTPIDNFEFFRPLIEARGRSFPSLTVPTWIMLIIASMCEFSYHVTKFCGFPLEPLLTRSEVLKVGYTHYCSIEKARKELGYKPEVTSVQGAERLANFYSKTVSNENFFEFSVLIWWILVIGGMSLTGMLGGMVSKECIASSPFLTFFDGIAKGIFHSQENIMIVFQLAVATHVLEATWAIKVAREDGCSNTWWMWFIQTLVLGYPSLGLLYKRRQWLRNRTSTTD